MYMKVHHCVRTGKTHVHSGFNWVLRGSKAPKNLRKTAAKESKLGKVAERLERVVSSHHLSPNRLVHISNTITDQSIALHGLELRVPKDSSTGEFEVWAVRCIVDDMGWAGVRAQDKHGASSATVHLLSHTASALFNRAMHLKATHPLYVCKEAISPNDLQVIGRVSLV